MLFCCGLVLRRLQFFIPGAYVVLGLVMLVLLLAIRLTKTPNLSEKGEKIEFGATLRRLIKNKNYVWGVIAQFFKSLSGL